MRCARLRTGLAALMALAIAGCASSRAVGPATTAAAQAATGPTSAATSTGGTTAPTAVATTVAPPPATTGPPPAVLPAPSGAAFYTPTPAQIEGSAGSVIWSTPDTRVPVAGATVSKILYRSRALDGHRIAVSGLLLVPNDLRPGAPVLSWAHGTTGSADQCAPSVSFGANTFPARDKLVAAGYVAVATDYEGLGTPGLHPYLVGESEGRGVLDAARAARQLTGASNRTMIWGHSQGGQSALWAGQLAPGYAPDLDVVGVIAAAPASQLSGLGAAAIANNAVAGFAVPFLAGMAAAHPELKLADVLSPAALALVPTLEQGCLGAYFDTFGKLATPAIAAGALSRTDWTAALAANDLGRVPITMPIMVAQGDADTTVPKALNDAYTADACRRSTTVEYRVYKGLTHITVMTVPIDDMLAYFADRLAGRPAPNTCAP
jgi:pimeloyl-ACP methyl ester carboxylesterase